MEFINGINIDITLEPDESGNELVVMRMGATRMELAPQQARMLATKLVMAVSRVDVHGEHRSPHSVAAPTRHLIRN